MARTSTYLNFMGNTEEAFNFYKSVFRTESNVSINLEPDSREEAERLFIALAEGGKVTMALQDMFWGAYFGSLTDKFGVQWMVNCTAAR
jgi:uncharacterized glyoxalase superfamily protein PhnB